jgi:cobalt-zinc-cadmium efflux system protein
MDPEEVEQEIRKQFPQIKNIHDFHIWEITSHLFAMTAHIEADIKNLEDTRILIDGLNQLISKKYGIGHTTFQVEAHSSQE